MTGLMLGDLSRLRMESAALGPPSGEMLWAKCIRECNTPQKQEAIVIVIIE
jgi:hypothetical protein